MEIIDPVELIMQLGEKAKRVVRANPTSKKIAKTIFKIAIDKEDKYLFNAYQRWLSDNAPSAEELAVQITEAKQLRYRPLISILIPTYNTNISFLRSTIESVFRQTYGKWELIIVDDASPNDEVRSVIKEYATRDNRIKCRFLDTNHHIAGATNEAITMSSGEFVSLFDHDDILWPNAMYEIVKALNERDLDFIYTDEDRIIGDRRVQPFFKPAWNQDFLWSINYITHITTIRKSVLERFRLDGDYNGSQDWELFLRITRDIAKDRIYHIPKVVYSWRVHEGSTSLALEIKPYVGEAQRKTLYSDLDSRGYKNFELQRDELYLAQWKLQFLPILPRNNPKVSIVFYGAHISMRTLSKLKKRTSYSNYDVHILGKDASYEDVLKVVTSEYVVLINKNIKFEDSHWLTYMLGDASREEIGCVLAWVTPKVVVRNLRSIIDDSAMSLLSLPVSRFITKNFYLTCKYDIGEFDGNVVMVNINKLKQVSLDSKRISLPEISSGMIRLAYVNLYNPHIRC